jgi:predicted  nucleic acid-binding Zn-ribbon protein
VTARRNQLLILLLFFGLIGIFSGVAIWQMNQSQQRERNLLQVKTELDQTNQQMQILKQQSNAALSTRSKLQKDLLTLKKQLDIANQRGTALEQNLKTAQTQSSALATENSSLKAKLAAAERQLTTSRGAVSGGVNGVKPNANAPVNIQPIQPIPLKR